MFSTIDHRPNRFIHAFVIRRRADGKLEEIPVPLPSKPNDINETARLIRSAPRNAEALKQLAHRLGAIAWVRAERSEANFRFLNTTMAKVALSTTARFIVASASDFGRKTATSPVAVDSIRVEAWKLGYDGDRQKLTTRMISQETVTLKARSSAR